MTRHQGLIRAKDYIFHISTRARCVTIRGKTRKGGGEAISNRQPPAAGYYTNHDFDRRRWTTMRIFL
jgi:hypothetical protein